jgi:hypothetical protein
MALTPEVLIINEVYLKKYTNVNSAVDPNLIRPAIYLAQDKYMVNYLGTNLMNKIKTDIDGGVLTGDYEILVDSFVRKSLLYWTMYELYPALVYKHDNGSIVQRTSEDTTTISDSILSNLRSEALRTAQFYTQRLIDYLRAYTHLYPEYTNNVFPNQKPHTKVYSQTGITYSRGINDNNFGEQWTKDDFLPIN